MLVFILAPKSEIVNTKTPEKAAFAVSLGGSTAGQG